MRRALLLCLVAVAVLAAGSASHAVWPRPAPASAAPQPAREEAQPHRIDVSVSGPADTLMRVARGGARTQVALRGQPFEHSFVEARDSTGFATLAVAAASRTPGKKPVRCEIRVDGVVVSRQSATEPDDTGLAQVLCRIPAHV